MKDLKDAVKTLLEKNLIDAMNSIKNYDLIGASLSFSEDNHQGLRSMQLLRCTDAEEYEIVSELISSTSDIKALVQQLEHM